MFDLWEFNLVCTAIKYIKMVCLDMSSLVSLKLELHSVYAKLISCVGKQVFCDR